jgi:hypothetical protein
MSCIPCRCLKLKNFVCLSVIYDDKTNYPYLFVETEIDNPKLDVAGIQVDFCGPHEFKLNFEEDKLLNLNFENKETKCFILPITNEDVSSEWIGVILNTNGPKKFEKCPEYVYIPQGKFN